MSVDLRRMDFEMKMSDFLWKMYAREIAADMTVEAVALKDI